MKNTIKMSLVAALAVAGLSSTASAGSLEEAIKGVSISGKMEVEYDWTETKNTGSDKTTENDWDLDWDVTAKIPVNDMVTAVFGAEGDTTTDTDTQDINDDRTKNNVQVTKVYFQYANGPVTALVGKQGMAGAPWFDDERANGVVGLVNAGPVTLAAAHFTGINASAAIEGSDYDSDNKLPLQDAQITAAAAIGSFGPVNAQLWYANLSGIANLGGNNTSADSIVVMADATFDIVNVGVKYGTTDYDTANTTGTTVLNDDAEMLQLTASVDLGAASIYAGYGATDSEQGGAGLDLTSDTDSVMDFGSETLSIDDLDNADAFLIGVTVPVDAYTFDVSYVDGEYDFEDSNTGGDFNELLITAEYQMSKNFAVTGLYSTSEIDTSATETKEVDTASIALEYKF